MSFGDRRYESGQHVRYVAQIHVPGIGWRDYVALPWLSSALDMGKRINEERERLRKGSDQPIPRFALARRVITNETLIEFGE